MVCIPQNTKGGQTKLKGGQTKKSLGGSLVVDISYIQRYSCTTWVERLFFKDRQHWSKADFVVFFNYSAAKRLRL